MKLNTNLIFTDVSVELLCKMEILDRYYTNITVAIAMLITKVCFLV